jgi:hypothetical protein
MELQRLDFEIECTAAKLMAFVDMRRRSDHPENIAHYARRVEETTEELKALHYQRLGKLHVAPKAKLPVYSPATVRNCAVITAAPVYTGVSYTDEYECMSCREIVLIDDIVDGICCDCRDKFAAVEDECECDWCGGSGWTERMRFGYAGGYSALKPCPVCNNG